MEKFQSLWIFIEIMKFTEVMLKFRRGRSLLLNFGDKFLLDNKCCSGSLANIVAWFLLRHLRNPSLLHLRQAWISQVPFIIQTYLQSSTVGPYRCEISILPEFHNVNIKFINSGIFPSSFQMYQFSAHFYSRISKKILNTSSIPRYLLISSHSPRLHYNQTSLFSQ